MVNSYNIFKLVVNHQYTINEIGRITFTKPKLSFFSY